MRDEIARLADIADRLDRAHALLELSQEQSSLEAMASKVDYASSALLGAQAALTELRALARTDHTEDKLGMVPEGWGIEQHNGGYMVNPPHGPGCWVSGRDDFNVPLADQALAKLCAAMLAAAPAPDHSAGAGGMVIDDAMVERLAKHLCREEWKNRCPTIEQLTAQMKHARRYHDEARAMLTAALAQPADAG